MAATKTGGKKKSSASKPGAGDAEVTLRGKEGRSSRARALSFDEPTALAMAEAVEAAPMPQIPRPATTRFPIDVESFLQLKSRARTVSPPAAAAEAVADRRTARSTTEAVPETALMAAAPAAAAAPLALVANFPGIAFNGSFPYDATCAAGPEHVMTAANVMVAFSMKSTGAVVLQRSLVQWFANVITGAKIFDPKVLYDQYAGRWVLLCVALAANPDRSWFLLSVSATADPRGRWFNYAMDATLNGATPTNNWADYPALGVDNQALYVTANMFRFGGAFQTAKLRVIPKTAPYAGNPIVFRDFARLSNDDGSPAFTVQPCHTFGAPGAQYLVNTIFPSTGGPVRDRLTVWTLKDPTGAATLTRRTLRIAQYSLPPDADQSGGGTPLDSGDIRVLNAVCSGGSVWCGFTTGHSWSGANRASCFWLQIEPNAGTILQQGIFGARAGSYFYPGVMVDVHGNMVMNFSRCSTTELASVFVTGRQTIDPPGSLRNSVLLKAGTANYTNVDNQGRNRWGDYSGAALDPTDSRTIWFYNGWASDPTRWSTQVGAARF